MSRLEFGDAWRFCRLMLSDGSVVIDYTSDASLPHVISIVNGVLARDGRAYNATPLADWFFRGNVLGNLPSPHILKVPKSFYQRPSGASGSDSRQSLSL